MKCEHAAEFIPDYLEGTLKPQDAERLEAHLESCAQCGKEIALARELTVLPTEEPSAALRTRFEAVLAAYEAGRRAGVARAQDAREPRAWTWNWFRSPALGFAAAAVLLVGGFLGGRYETNTNGPQSHDEVAALQGEVQGMRQLMVLSMLQEESASERLQGVSLSTREEQMDPKILTALLHTVRYDSSVDVRMAAIDALSRYGNHAQVRDGLAEALETNQSPLVQVQLIDLLVQLHDRNIIDQLHKIEQDTDVNPAVRERAQQAIAQLS